MRDISIFIARNQRQRFADETVNFDFNWPLKSGRAARETPAQAPVEFGIVGFPNFIADLDPKKIPGEKLTELRFGYGDVNFINASEMCIRDSVTRHCLWKSLSTARCASRIPASA